MKNKFLPPSLSWEKADWFGMLFHNETYWLAYALQPFMSAAQVSKRETNDHIKVQRSLPQNANLSTVVLALTDYPSCRRHPQLQLDALGLFGTPWNTPHIPKQQPKKKKKKNWLRQTIGELSHTSCQCTDVLLFSSQFHSRDGCYMLCQLSHRQRSQKLQDAPIPQNVFIPEEKYEADLKVRFDPQSAKYPCF